ncbi:MAG: hypothetical protein H0W81_08825 [Chloroflexi bacterium]|nr:hypothetical protein [Chloroflexota bacterium]
MTDRHEDPPEHQCDDTAYSAAAMPGECTCPSPAEASLDRLERDAARRRIAGYQGEGPDHGTA